MKNFIGLLIFVALLVVAYFIYKGENGDAVFEKREAFKDFAIEDTASVDQIFMSQPNGKKVLLSRRGFDKWMVNGDFEARPYAVNLILQTLHDIKVQAPVSKKTFDGVVKRLASGSTKVEYYLDGEEEPEKTWYIGDATSSRLGTYMLLEKNGKKSTKPYITYLMMERGFLGPRFFVEPHLWRDRLFLRLEPEKIRSLCIQYATDSMESFCLDQVETAQFEISKLDGSKSEPLGEEIAIPYLKKFGTIYYEYIDRKTPQAQLDSIYNSLPRQKIEIRMMDGTTHQVRTYHMPVKAGSELDGKPIDYHPERMYAYSSYMGKEFYPIVQNLTYQPLLLDYKDLTSSTNVEK
ncbi:MAG: hypothetical protein RIC95_07535 [Vicingaceae bacterium]